MRKTAISVIIACFIVCGGVKPAEALIIDPGQIAAKVSDFVQKISDSVSRITQQINQVKMMATQGYSLKSLKDMAKKYYKIDQTFLTKRMFKLIKGTKKKQKEVLQKDADLYKEVSVAQAEEKLNEIDESISYIEDEIEEADKKYRTWRDSLCPRYKAEYDAMTEEGSEKEKKWNQYTKCEAERDLYQLNAAEYSQLLNELGREKEKLEKELEEKRSGDDTYKGKLKRVEQLESQKDGDDNNLISAEDQISEDDEWDKIKPEDIAAKFSPSEKDYEEFMDRYFYDPDKLEGQGEERYAFQSNMDRILRERRYLFINTAVHLMQVATTIRREIPVRTVVINKMANDTSTEDSEISAMSAYSATRVENIKVLFLYAQLLSAKLQYLAARDLLQADLKKEYADRHNFNEFDLGRYILDSDYIQKLLDEANTTIKPEDIDNYK